MRGSLIRKHIGNRPVTTICIIRHAEKVRGDFYNPHLRHQDEPITANGKLVSEKLWSYFSEKTVPAIYISEYLRTAQTAAHLAGQLGLTPIVDKRLNEIDNGLFEGLSAEEVREKYPNEWKAFQERKEDFRFPEGETGEEARERIAGILEEKRLAYEDGNVIFFCHEGLIRILMCHLMGLPVHQRGNFQMDFCGIMEITYQTKYNKWKLIRFNQRATG